MNYFYNKYAENRVQIRKWTVGWKHSMHSFEGCFLPFQWNRKEISLRWRCDFNEIYRAISMESQRDMNGNATWNQWNRQMVSWRTYCGYTEKASAEAMKSGIIVVKDQPEPTKRAIWATKGIHTTFDKGEKRPWRTLKTKLFWCRIHSPECLFFHELFLQKGKRSVSISMSGRMTKLRCSMRGWGMRRSGSLMVQSS